MVSCFQLTEEVGEGEGDGVAEKGMIPQSPRTPTSPVLSAIAGQSSSPNS